MSYIFLRFIFTNCLDPFAQRSDLNILAHYTYAYDNCSVYYIDPKVRLIKAIHLTELTHLSKLTHLMLDQYN